MISINYLTIIVVLFTTAINPKIGSAKNLGSIQDNRCEKEYYQESMVRQRLVTEQSPRFGIINPCKDIIEIEQFASQSKIYTYFEADHIEVGRLLNSSIINAGPGDDFVEVTSEVYQSNIKTEDGDDTIIIGKAINAFVHTGNGSDTIELLNPLESISNRINGGKGANDEIFIYADANDYSIIETESAIEIYKTVEGASSDEFIATVRNVEFITFVTFEGDLEIELTHEFEIDQHLNLSDFGIDRPSPWPPNKVLPPAYTKPKLTPSSRYRICGHTAPKAVKNR